MAHTLQVLMLLLCTCLVASSPPNEPGHCVGDDTGHFEPNGDLNCGTCIGSDKAIDCGWRTLALEMAIAKLGKGVSTDVHDALQLTHLCGADRPSTSGDDTSSSGPSHQQIHSQEEDGIKIFVDANEGESAADADGSASRPFNTLEQARDAIRTLPRGINSKNVTVLLNGTFHRSEPLVLEAQDSGVSWSTHPAAASPAVISGSTLLKGATWTLAQGMPGVYVTQLPRSLQLSASSSNVSFRSLYVAGRRYWPARYPNNPDPSRSLYPNGYSFNATWGAAMQVRLLRCYILYCALRSAKYTSPTSTLLTIHYSPYTTHHTLLTIHYSPYTTHHPLLTIHFTRSCLCRRRMATASTTPTEARRLHCARLVTSSPVWNAIGLIPPSPTRPGRYNTPHYSPYATHHLL
jgi:hypothetical protein